MAIIPSSKRTTEYAIESLLLRRKPRTYLGMSSLGGRCLRAQWYGWRWATAGSISARVGRIFSRGHIEEPWVIKDLNSVGIKVFRRKGGFIIPMTGAIGEKQETIIGFHKHCMGHPDGRLLGVKEAPKTEHLLEIKSMKDSKFQELAKDKNLPKVFPAYYSQVQRYSGGLGLKRILFIATNKDNQSRIYIRLKHDPEEYRKLVMKEGNIIQSELPPKKAFHSDHYLCSWCQHNTMCHYGKDPAQNCRTCKYSDVLDGGKWGCSYHNKRISTARQRKGCDKYKRLF